jgi:CubicO group peptidase (beta-lactamase class C family)
MLARLWKPAIFLFVAVNLWLLLFGKTYVYTAVLHQAPNIDDLDLFPLRTVAASPDATPWPKALDYNQGEYPAALTRVLEEFGTTQFLVIQNGEIKFERYWDGYAPDDESRSYKNSNSFSAAKSIVSILIGAALKDGHIQSLDQKVAEYVDSFNNGAKADITIRQVLQMASGLDFMEAYNKPVSDTTEAYYGDDLVGLIDRLGIEEIPGTTWRYKSGDTQVLAMVLMAATDKSLSQYASEALWSKIGATEDAHWSLDKENGVEKAYCCFYSNARDFARIAQLYMNAGKTPSGEQIVTAEYVQQSVVPNGIPADGEQAPSHWYGYQWWIMQHEGHPIFYARGILGQYVMAIPDLDVIIVRLGHERSETKINRHPIDVYGILDGVFELLKVPKPGEQ